MINTARVTILMFAGLLVTGIWQAAFQEGFSWAAWLDSWFFSLLSMLLIIALVIGCGALLVAVIRHLWNIEPCEENSEKEMAKKI
jgi:hypothetical protein